MVTPYFNYMKQEQFTKKYQQAFYPKNKGNGNKTFFIYLGSEKKKNYSKDLGLNIF